MNRSAYLYLSILLAFTACDPKTDQQVGTDTPVTTSQPQEQETDSSTLVNSATNDTIAWPAGHTSLGDAEGDLNKDGVSEKVVVFDTGEEGDFGTGRILNIYQQKGNKWVLWKENMGGVLPSNQGGGMGDPFVSILIERGTIVTEHFGGSSEKWNYLHRFRYQNEAFELIGTTVGFGREPLQWTEFDYNLSTGSILLTKRNETEGDESEAEPTEEKFRQKPTRSYLLGNFVPGDNELTLTVQGKEEVYYF